MQIQNKLHGKGFVDRIKISRFADFPELGKAECYPLSDPERKWSEDEWYSLKIPVVDKINLVCEMTVNYPLEIAEGKSSGVKFFAFVDYTYTQRHLESAKILGTGLKTT